MARTSSNFTQAEISYYEKWCFKHGIIYDTVSGPDSPAAYNAEFVTNYFFNTWNQDMTETNLELAFPELQKHLKFWSRSEAEYHRLLEQYGKTWCDSIWHYFGGHRLAPTYDNFVTIANFVKAHGWGTENRDSFTRMLGNLQNSRQGQYGAALEFKPNPDEVANQRALEQAVTPVRKVTQEERDAAVSHIHGMGGPERSRPYKLVNANTPTRQEPVQPSDEGSYWSGRVRDFLANIPSNVIRAEAETLYGHLNNGSWYATYRMLEGWYDRRKLEAVMAGTKG